MTDEIALGILLGSFAILLFVLSYHDSRRGGEK